jgi:predicted Mrr-cat superfamily restriction endonuclease
LLKEYGGEGSKKNDVSANDDILNKVQIGDVIIAKRGRSELIGYGIVSSDYSYDENRTEYQSISPWCIKRENTL